MLAVNQNALAAHESPNAGLGLAGRVNPYRIRWAPTGEHPAARLFSIEARRYAARFDYQPTQAPEFFPIPRDEDGYDVGARLLQWDRIPGNGRAPLGYAVVGVPWSPAERADFSDLLDGFDCGSYPVCDLPRILGIGRHSAGLAA